MYLDMGSGCINCFNIQDSVLVSGADDAKASILVSRASFPKPEVLLSNMNKILKGKSGGEFVTACYGYIDIKRKILKTGNAGHSDLLVYLERKDTKNFQFKSGRCSSLYFQNPEYESIEFQLEKEIEFFFIQMEYLKSRNEKEEEFGEKVVLVKC